MQVADDALLTPSQGDAEVRAAPLLASVKTPTKEPSWQRENKHATNDPEKSRSCCMSMRCVQNCCGTGTQRTRLSPAAGSICDASLRSLSTHSSSDSQDVVLADRASLCSTTSPKWKARDGSARTQIVEAPNSHTNRSRDGKASPTTASSPLKKSSGDLHEIKQSVRRLRTQRSQVEQIKQRNLQLELRVSEQNKEMEKLRSVIASLHGVEQENVGLLQSFKLVEERIRNLEENCSENKEDARRARDQVLAAEMERDELSIQIDELIRQRDKLCSQAESEATAHRNHVDQLTRKHEQTMEMLRESERSWQARLDSLQITHSHSQRKLRKEATTLRHDNQKLVCEITDLERQVQQLLATTVRQTTMIEDCDRALSESKSRLERANASYHDQLASNGQLKEKNQEMETNMTTTVQCAETEKRHLEARIHEMELKLKKLKDRNDTYRVAIQEKENRFEEVQKDLLVRERNRFHIEEVAKSLRKREKALLLELSELKIAITDMTSEKNDLVRKVKKLEAQLAREHKDRSRWASARLKLLVAFCDEENKLSSVLNQYSTLELLVEGDDREGGADDDDYGIDDGEDEGICSENSDDDWSILGDQTLNQRATLRHAKQAKRTATIFG